MATIGLPVNLDQDARPLRAVGSSEMTSRTWPVLSWRICVAIIGVSVEHAWPTRSMRMSGAGGLDASVIFLRPICDARRVVSATTHHNGSLLRFGLGICLGGRSWLVRGSTPQP